MDTVVTVDDDDEEEEDKQTNNQHHSGVQCSLATLCDWYSSQAKVRQRTQFVFKIHSQLHQVGVQSPSRCTFSFNYRNPAVEHLGKSAALLVEMVHSNLRL